VYDIDIKIGGSEMKKVYTAEIPKTDRIQKLIDDLYSGTPTIESDRAEIITESFKNGSKKCLQFRITR
jgi:hypothetical protein